MRRAVRRITYLDAARFLFGCFAAGKNSFEAQRSVRNDAV
jgi:hypothetical protein